MTPLTIESDVHFRRQGRGSRKVLEAGPAPGRVARLMALALKCDGLLQDGVLNCYSEIAALGHITRARVSQIMNLTNLAPDIQAAILDLPRTETGRDPITLAQLQPIASTIDWKKQRRLWSELTAAGRTPQK